MLLMFNADHANTISFTFPKSENGAPWELVFDTARPELTDDSNPPPGQTHELAPCSVAVFRSKVPRSEETL